MKVILEERGGRMGSMSEWKSDGVPRGLLDPDNTSFWREQKRFVLKCLRDYGFGKKSEQNIQDEAKLVRHGGSPLLSGRHTGGPQSGLHSSRDVNTQSQAESGDRRVSVLQRHSLRWQLHVESL